MEGVNAKSLIQNVCENVKDARIVSAETLLTFEWIVLVSIQPQT